MCFSMFLCIYVVQGTLYQVMPTLQKKISIVDCNFKL